MSLLFKTCNNNKQFLIISFILCFRKNYFSRVENYKMLRYLINFTYKIYKLKKNCDNCKFRDVSLNVNIILKIEMRLYKRLRKNNNKINENCYNFLIKYKKIILLSLLIIL